MQQGTVDWVLTVKRGGGAGGKEERKSLRETGRELETAGQEKEQPEEKNLINGYRTGQRRDKGCLLS